MPHRPTEAAAKIAGKAKAAKAIITGQRGIFRKLQEEHAEVSMLMSRVGASSDAKVRRELFPKIRQELLSHAKAEEKEFYSVLKRFDQTKAMVMRSQAEHNQIESIIGELDALDMSGKAWADRFEDLVKKVQEHVRQEEHDVFPKAQKVLSNDEAEDIEHRFLRQKQAELGYLAH